MALIAQDGTGLSTANSYISVADADAYFSARNNTDWAGYITAEKEAALIYATAWLDNTYRWYSIVVNYEQSTGWPRVAFYDHEGRLIAGDSIPQKIKDATCEIAREHMIDNVNSSAGDNIKEESVYRTRIVYNGSASNKSYSYIKLMLRDYGTAGSANNGVLWRA
jgi:hypothetical protein